MMPDQEILEFLLRAISRPRAGQLAKALLLRYRSLARLIAAPVWDLLKVDGLGATGVALLKAVDVTALRKVRAEAFNRPIYGDWDRLIPYLHAEMSREQVEKFHVLFLDNRNRLLADEEMQRGTVDHTPVVPREVVKRALELQATGLILAHNHPSGDPTPSRDDIIVTGLIKAAAAPLSITVLDHIVVGNGRWFSFRMQGLLGQCPGSGTIKSDLVSENRSETATGILLGEHHSARETEGMINASGPLSKPRFA
jgi:DNA repair protein RadC